MIDFFCYMPHGYHLIDQTDEFILEALKDSFKEVNRNYLSMQKFTQDDLEKLKVKIDKIQSSGMPVLLFDSCGKMTTGFTDTISPKYHISYYSDVPYGEYLQYIMEKPKDSCISYSDQNFKIFFEDTRGNDAQEFIFLPHGGPNRILSIENIEDRPIDHFFCGNVYNPTCIKDLISKYSNNDPLVQNILNTVLERAVEEHIDLYVSLKETSLEAGYSPFQVVRPDRFHQFMMDAIYWKENLLRFKTLQAFAGKGLHLAGVIDKAVIGLHQDDFHYLGPRSSIDVIEMMKNSKVVLNPVSVFPGGSHERIWFSMAAGATVLSDRSTFLEETLTDKENIFYIDYNNLGDQAEELVDICQSQSEKLQKMVDDTRDIYLQNHTWIERIKKYVIPSKMCQSYLADIAKM